MGLRAGICGAALALITILPLPLAGEVACVARKDLPLIYSPDEPPVCPDLPTPMADLVPSSLGRPSSAMAEFMAGCAGMTDAIATRAPEVPDHPDYVSGDAFFGMAKEWRERPTTQTLESYRIEARRYWIATLGPEVNASGSLFTHAVMACMDEVRVRGDN